MKPFVFSLERMRNYREQILTAEKNRLAALQKKRDEVNEQIARLEQYRRDAAGDMRKKERVGVNAIELSSYKFLMENTRSQIEALQVDLIKRNEEVARQLKVVIAASRERTSLDKLEEKQWEEYKLLAAKDEEIRISEQVSLTLVRNKAKAK